MVAALSSFVALLTASYSGLAVRGDQPPGIDYLGAGYDLVFGNPDGSEAASSVTDPGFRVHIIKFTWSNTLNTCSGLSNNWTCPNELTILPQTSCMQQSSSSKIESTKSFQQVLQKDAKVTASVKGSYGGFSASAAFSGSRTMATMKNKIENEKITTFQSKAVCVEYSATLKSGIDTSSLEPLAQFSSAVAELPLMYNSCFQLNSTGGPCPQRIDNGFGDVPPMKKTARRQLQAPDDDDSDDDDTVNECACDPSVIKYFRFIQLFGTHYTTKVEMGGKIIHRVEIKQSDVSVMESKKVDIAYGASMKASYKSGFGASASVSASVSAAKSDAEKSYESVMNVAKKELNINVGGSPSDDWREWAKSTMDTPMPIRYTLTSLVDLVAKVDAKKAPLFEQAVADYIAAYGRTLTFDTATNMNVMFVEVQYSLLVGAMTSATFRLMIGKTGDMIPAQVTVTKPTGSIRVAVPKQYQMSYDVFAGNIPVTLEYVSGVFTAPKMVVMMEARQEQTASRRDVLHVTEMEALMANKKKKKAPAVASTPTSVYFTTIQPFAVMADDSLLPLDDQYAGKSLGAVMPWAINPMD
uniref:MACPF domain-containing protein n=1 Tax=Globisporangium ultimum (strain ATCC 200006 / CBS 805.95 / DAOM BR144) TaxID=431595 RepID=K3W565_GLOUD